MTSEHALAAAATKKSTDADLFIGIGRSLATPSNPFRSGLAQFDKYLAMTRPPVVANDIPDATILPSGCTATAVN